MQVQHSVLDDDRLMSNELFELVLPRLEQLAHVLLSREPGGHPLRPMKLVNKFYKVPVPVKGPDWRDRGRFFAIAGRAMRWRLTDMGCRTPVRGVPLEEVPSPSFDLDVAIDINRLLDELATTDPQWCAVVKLKCFLGFTDQEAAEELGVPCCKVRKIWRNARWWLRQRMEANATT